MSLGIVIKGPDGIVLAAESRVTLQVTGPGGDKSYVNFDNAKKLLSFGDPHNSVGAVTFGAAAIQDRTAHSFIPEFETSLPNYRIPVQEFAQKMSTFFMDQWTQKMPVPPTYQGNPMIFVVGGFDENDPYGRVF